MIAVPGNVGNSQLDPLGYGQSDPSTLSYMQSNTTIVRKSETMPTAVMMFGLIGLIMLVVFVGVMLAFLTGDAIEPLNVSQQPSGPPSEESGNPAFNEHNGPKPQPRAGAEEDLSGGAGSEDLRRGRSGGIPGTIAPPAPTGLTQRSGITVCVVGVSFSSESLFSGGWCDYAIYPELEVIASELAPRHGQSSWKAFKKAIALQPDMGTGVSFSLRNFGDAVSPVASLPGQSSKLAQLVRTMNLSAMGVLNFKRHLGVNTNALSAAFRVMDAALKQQSYTEHMVFLGAVLVDKQSRTDFVNEVNNMEHLTTIILETHMHGDPDVPL
ncbi:hypothetical protein MTO96_007336 [Rhipicephalus appendiculatus]